MTNKLKIIALALIATANSMVNSQPKKLPARQQIAIVQRTLNQLLVNAGILKELRQAVNNNNLSEIRRILNSPQVQRSIEPAIIALRSNNALTGEYANITRQYEALARQARALLTRPTVTRRPARTTTATAQARPSRRTRATIPATTAPTRQTRPAAPRPAQRPAPIRIIAEEIIPVAEEPQVEEQVQIQEEQIEQPEEQVQIQEEQIEQPEEQVAPIFNETIRLIQEKRQELENLDLENKEAAEADLENIIFDLEEIENNIQNSNLSEDQKRLLNEEFEEVQEIAEEKLRAILEPLAQKEQEANAPQVVKEIQQEPERRPLGFLEEAMLRARERNLRIELIRTDFERRLETLEQNINKAENIDVLNTIVDNLEEVTQEIKDSNLINKDILLEKADQLQDSAREAFEKFF